jgi:hypothetical protein
VLSVLLVNNEAGVPSVGVLVGQHNVFLTTEGHPYSGVALAPDAAREVAGRLMRFAAQLDAAAKHPPGRKIPGYLSNGSV